jgi:hypothetical protein
MPVQCNSKATLAGQLKLTKRGLVPFWGKPDKTPKLTGINGVKT